MSLHRPSAGLLGNADGLSPTQIVKKRKTRIDIQVTDGFSAAVALKSGIQDFAPEILTCTLQPSWRVNVIRYGDLVLEIC